MLVFARGHSRRQLSDHGLTQYRAHKHEGRVDRDHQASRTEGFQSDVCDHHWNGREIDDKRYTESKEIPARI